MKDFNAGNFINQGSFISFIPEEINRDWVLDDLGHLGIIKEITGAKRGEQYCFDDYIKLFK